jgi:hypothetical protein
VLRKRLTLRGFIVWDFAARQGDFLRNMGEWPKPLCRKVSSDVVDAGDVAARSVEARNETVSNRVIASPEDDRNGRGCGLGGERYGT